MFVFKSAIGGDGHVTFQLFHQHVIFQVLPAEIKECPDIFSRERLHQARINRRVYDDAHTNWSNAMSRLSSRKEKTCCLGIEG